MPDGIWAIGEAIGGSATRSTLELATLARTLAAAAGTTSTTVVLGDGAAAAAEEVARYAARVLALEVTGSGDQPLAAMLAPRVASLVTDGRPAYLLIGASGDGRDLAGALMALLELPVLVGASAVTWGDTGPVVEMSTFGGRLVTRSAFSHERGIVLVRPASVTAAPADQVGTIETVDPAITSELAGVRVTDRVDEAGAAASIEDARIIVGGGRGVGGPDGFRHIQALADALGGAVGATRAVVDAGWIGYGQQIGQTGKIVKPALYIACGISGAIQHKVGVQTAGAIVAINKDPDAPISEFADLVVVGDLFQIVPLLTEAIVARKPG